MRVQADELEPFGFADLRDRFARAVQSEPELLIFVARCQIVVRGCVNAAIDPHQHGLHTPECASDRL